MTKENSTLQKKLASYVAVAGAVLAAAPASNAQIIYTDVNPDVTLAAGDTYGMDLNNDGNIDYQYVVNIGSGYVVAGVLPYGPYASSNLIQGTLAPNAFGANYAYPSKVSAGDPINGSQGWFGFADINIPYNSANYFFIPGFVSIFGSGTFGQWQGGVTDHYVGMHFTDGTNFYYGWARIDVGADALSIVIKDYAYQSTGDTPLNAGVVSSVGDVKLDGVNIFCYEGVVNINTNLVGANATITNMLGQKVVSAVLQNQNTRIDLNQFGKGIYMVNVEKDGKIMSKKVSSR